MSAVHEAIEMLVNARKNKPKYGPPRPIPEAVRALYARFVKEFAASEAAGVAAKIAMDRARTTHSELVYALTGLDPDARCGVNVREVDVDEGGGGTYRVELRDEPLPARPPWVEEEIAKLDAEGGNG